MSESMQHNRSWLWLTSPIANGLRKFTPLYAVDRSNPADAHG